MSDKPRVLIVDDTESNRLLLSMLLEDDYEVVEADSGEACLVEVKQQKPDIILLDITMPGMSGYEVCVELRKQKDTEHLPIIFVSALVGTEEKLAGFEAGGDDYLTKPVEEDVLLEKITSCLQRQQNVSTAQNEASEAMRIAMEAMTVSSELGQIVQFVKNVQDLKSPKAVGEAIRAIAAEFSLNSAAMVKADVSEYVGCEVDSMEAKVLDHASRSNERLISVGIRTIIRNDDIILLIKDMPQEDENRSGRLKDHLAVLMDIANGRLLTLEVQLSVKKERKDFLETVISLSEKQISSTSDKLHKYHENSQTIMEGMLNELENMLFGLGLDEDQEKQLMALANQSSSQLQELQGTTKDLDSDLGIIVTSLQKFMNQEG